MKATRFALFFFLVIRIHGDVNLSPFCEKAISNSSGVCPEVSTFDIIDISAYAGVWYEIGSTAQFKLLSEAGLDCLQANYTVQVSNDTTVMHLRTKKPKVGLMFFFSFCSFE